MKKTERKLKLDKQTIQQLDNTDLAGAQGGSGTYNCTYGPSGTYNCPPIVISRR